MASNTTPGLTLLAGRITMFGLEFKFSSALHSLFEKLGRGVLAGRISSATGFGSVLIEDATALTISSLIYYWKSTNHLSLLWHKRPGKHLTRVKYFS